MAPLTPPLDDEGVARVWDTRDGNAAGVTLVDAVPPEESAVPSCRGGQRATWGGDGRYLVTGGEDHLIRVFDLQDHQQVASIEMDTEVRRLRFTPDDRHIVAVGTDELLGRTPIVNWRWRPADLLEAMTARGARRMSRDEWSRYLGAEPPLVPPALEAR